MRGVLVDDVTLFPNSYSSESKQKEGDARGYSLSLTFQIGQMFIFQLSSVGSHKCESSHPLSLVLREKKEQT
jgi:hypothetical protein